MSKRNTYDWPALVAKLRRRPGRWVLALADVPASTEKLVRLRRHPALRLEGETVLASMRNVYTDSDGHRRGDVYLKIVSRNP